MATSLFAINEEKLKKFINKSSSSMGHFFVVAIPPNEDDDAVESLAEISLEIYISSNTNALVKISNPITGLESQVTVTLGQITTINEDNGLTWDYEILESESGNPVNKAIVIESDKPISVYVMNSKDYTTEGYLALPVNLWGKEYTHCSFWDQRENDLRQSGGGFVLIASEDGTQATIQIGGRDLDTNNNQSTHSGRNISDRFTVRLELGQCYQILGTGDTRGRFDISGSKVTANKPIGMISVSYTHLTLPTICSV